MSTRRSRRPSDSSAHSSSHAPRQPKWRSPTAAAQPATSISKVFAQPLQASPLRSALDTVAGLDDAASIASDGDPARRRERALSAESDAADATSAENAGSAKASDAAGTKEEISEQESPIGITNEEQQAELETAPPPPSSSPSGSSTPLPVSPPAGTSAPVPVSAPSSAASNLVTQSRSPSRPSSWLETLSRSLAGSSVTERSQEKEIPPTTAQITDTTVTGASGPPQSQAISIPPVSPSDASDSASTTRPTSPRTDSGATSAISSIDDEVPPHRLPPDASAVGPETTIAHRLSMSTLTPSASSVSSLNPSSSSRFMLRIPLLGRPKMPLDQAVAQAAADDIRSTKSEGSGADTSKAPATLPGSPVPQVVVSVPSAPDLAAEADADVLNHVASPPSSTHASSAATPAPSDPPATEGAPEEARREEDRREEAKRDEPAPDPPAPSSSSWFSYLRWSESSTVVNTSASDPKIAGGPAPSAPEAAQADAHPAPSSEPAQPELEPAQSEPAPAADDSARRRTTSDTPAPAAPAQAAAAPAKRHSSEVSRAEIKELVSSGDGEGGAEKRQTPSLFSAETARSQGSAWYAPWAWYAASPVVPSGSSLAGQAGGAGEGRGDGEGVGSGEGGEGEGGHQKTESEMVKEEALAREEAKEAAEAAAEAQAKEDPPPEAANPIEASLSTHREGWMSFFMSKALLMKSVTEGAEGQRDENGMEVMDVEEEGEAEAREVKAEVEGGEGVSAEEAKGSKDAKGSQDAKEVKDAKEPKRSAPQAISIVAGKKAKSTPTSPTAASSAPASKSPPAPPPKEREPKKSGPPAPPLTDSEQVKRETARAPSPAPSRASAAAPNLVLPTWADTFHTPPRSHVPPPRPPAPRGALGKTLQALSDVLLGGDGAGSVRRKGKGRAREEPSGHDVYAAHGAELPKALDVLGAPFDAKALDGSCRVVVIGVAGWSPGALTRTLAGGLPSSSSKFVNMTCAALEQFEAAHGFRFAKVTKMPLEGDGTIERKVAKVHEHLLGNDAWRADLHAADVVFVATHSQGSVVSTHLLARLLAEGHILTQTNMDLLARTAAAVAPGGVAPRRPAQRVCCLALCGIHLGPLRYLRTSSLLQPYIQYFENAAARELFDFQNTESEVSRSYVKALNTVMDHGTKMVYVASLNDQVVPIYSGIFASAAHPRILRALYIDGDAYSSSDFLSNLLVLLIRIRNAGLSDSGLLTHLSEATAGTLSGVGHSTAYEEPAVYALAVDYAFLASDGGAPDAALAVDAFNAVDEQNDYEIPWALRDLIADARVAHFFAREFAQLRDAFDDWAPKTSILRDVKRKLQPITRLAAKGGALGSRL